MLDPKGPERERGFGLLEIWSYFFLPLSFPPPSCRPWKLLYIYIYFFKQKGIRLFSAKKKKKKRKEKGIRL